MAYFGGRKAEQVLISDINEEQKNEWASKYTLRRNGTQSQQKEYLRFKIKIISQNLVRVPEKEKKREEEVQNSLSQRLYTTLHWLS